MTKNLDLSSEYKKKISSIFDGLKHDTEFEIMFFNQNKKARLGFHDFLNILKYISYKSKKLGLKQEYSNTLDIVYTHNKEYYENYRITLHGLEKINSTSKSMAEKKNHIIFTLLLSKYGNTKDENVSMMKKIRDIEQTFDISEYNLRVRVSTESDFSKDEMDMLSKINESKRFDIKFRYKERTSLIVVDNKDIQLRVDLTLIKFTNMLKKIEHAVPTYELEIEIVKKNDKGKLDKKHLDEMYNELSKLMMVLQQSPYIISNPEKESLLKYYNDLVNGGKSKMISLNGRQPVSLEIQHVVDKLPNKYCVTDKADGDRYFMVIMGGKVYLISNNLVPKYTGIDGKSKYDGTIADGELIYIKKHNKHIMMLFDLLFYKGKDIRDEALFSKRYELIGDVVKNAFGNKIESNDYKGEFNIKNIVKHHSQEIDKYMDGLNNDIANDKIPVLVRRKYFVLPYGGQDNEVFVYAKLMWDKYVYDKNTKCPYLLDGLIFQPLEQKYITILKDIKYFEYKWKPEDKNSIDFFITFERNPETGQIMTLYDDSNDEFIKGKMYRICHLHVGRQTRYGEQPTLFQRKEGKYIIYLFLDEGEVRDLDGKVLQDKTVVEFYYNYDPNLDERYRWIPIKTRLDKTESVLRHKRKYGNNQFIANKIWRSIINPFLMSDINILSENDNYSEHMVLLRNKVSAHLISLENKQNVYYQKTTNLAKPLRYFHNWIKSNNIYTYCSPSPHKSDGRNKQYTVLDLGCGRGGDIMKFWHSKVREYVGLDIDNNGLTSATNGAISRYNQLRRAHTNFPKMSFINADSSAILNPEEQTKAIGNIMSNINKNLIEKFFSPKSDYYQQFDRINCQFMLHYMLGTELSWSNFTTNVKTFLKPGGFMLITCFDGDKVLEFLEDKQKKTVYYTDKQGEKDVFFEIVKKFKSVEKDRGLGHAIDVNNAMISEEGVYITEYLVFKDFLVKEFAKRCDMELVETDTFENIYNINRSFLKSLIGVEENLKTRDFFKNIYSFYNMEDSVNKASFEMSRLNRFYIFKKRDDAPNDFFKAGKKAEQEMGKQKRKLDRSKGRSTSKNKKGGFVDVTDDVPVTESSDMSTNEKVGEESLKHMSHLLNSKKFIRRTIDNSTLLGSIIDIFNTTFEHDLSKKVISSVYKKFPNGKSITLDNLEKIASSLKIKHGDNKYKGVNIFVIEEDEFNINTIPSHTNGNIDRDKPTILLYKTEDKYYPIYKVMKNEKSGIFSSYKSFVDILLDKGDGEDEEKEFL